MKKTHADPEPVLLDRLGRMGIEHTVIHGLLKDIFNLFYMNPRIDRLQLNEKLRYRGWKKVELDTVTFSLARRSLQG